LEYFTIAWNMLEGLLSVIAGFGVQRPQRRRRSSVPQRLATRECRRDRLKLETRNLKLDAALNKNPPSLGSADYRNALQRFEIFHQVFNLLRTQSQGLRAVVVLHHLIQRRKTAVVIEASLLVRE
jgi:hypothetical protein